MAAPQGLRRKRLEIHPGNTVGNNTLCRGSLSVRKSGRIMLNLKRNEPTIPRADRLELGIERLEPVLSTVANVGA